MSFHITLDDVAGGGRAIFGARELEPNWPSLIIAEVAPRATRERADVMADGWQDARPALGRPQELLAFGDRARRRHRGPAQS